MELRHYLEILERRWRSALLVALVIIGLGALGSRNISPEYQAETLLRMTTPLSGSSGTISHETGFADRLINTYAQIASSEEMRNELKKKLVLETLPNITVGIIPSSEIIQVKVESSNPALAAKAANTLAGMLVSYRDNTVSITDSKELNLLADRRDTLKAELDQYQQEHDQLVQTYSQTAADMNVLNRTIQLKEASFQSLSNQYELTVVDVLAGRMSAAQRDALAKGIDRLGEELNSLNEQYKALSIKSDEYLQQITLLRLFIQSTQTTYSNVLNQYDTALSTYFRKENAENMIIVSPAVEPTYPSSPGGSFVFGLSVILGLIIGIVTAFVVDYLDPRIYSPGQITRLTSAPLIGSISKSQPQQTSNLPDHNDPLTQRDYWILSARLQALIQENSIKTILVTSPNEAEGRSTITYKLALGLAQNNSKVLVVDGNLRMPMQHKLFNVTGDYGLINFLNGEQDDLKDILLKDVKPGIDLLPSLIECDDPIELLQTRRLKTLFESFKGYDVALFDTPAFLAVPDALALSKTVDGVITIAQWGHTTSGDIQSVCSYLESVNSKILGVVVNETPVRKDAGSYFSGKRRSDQKIKEIVVSSA